MPAVSVPRPTIYQYTHTKNDSWKPTKSSIGNMKGLIVFLRLDRKSRAFAANDVTEGVPAGMVIDEIKDDGEPIANTPAVVSKRLGAKKTKQQCAPKAKQKAKVRIEEIFDCG